VKKSNILWVKKNYKEKFLTNSILKSKIDKYNFAKKKIKKEKRGKYCRKNKKIKSNRLWVKKKKSEKKKVIHWKKKEQKKKKLVGASFNAPSWPLKLRTVMAEQATESALQSLKMRQPLSQM